MEPKYFIENRYSIYPVLQQSLVAVDYQVNSPETTFEKKVFGLYLQGKKYLYREEYTLALNAFQELRQLILKTVNPKLPPHPKPRPSKGFDVVDDISILNPLIQKTGAVLQATPTEKYRLPQAIYNSNQTISDTLANKINAQHSEGEMQLVSYHDEVEGFIDAAMLASENKDWQLATSLYTKALNKTPNTDKVLEASLQHDMGIVLEKANQRDKAKASMEKSIGLFKSAKTFEGQANSLKTLASMQARGGEDDKAKTTIAKYEKLVKDKNLHHVTFESNNINSIGTRPTLSIRNTHALPQTLNAPVSPVINPVGATINMMALSPSLVSEPRADVKVITFLGKTYLQNKEAKVEKKMFIQGDNAPVELMVNNKVGTNLTSLFENRVASTDFFFITGFLYNPVQMVTYLPHMYFFVLPMAIGDCLVGLGRYFQAEEKYLSTLKYPYINKKTEIVNLWLRLTEVTLERADRAYKIARDKVSSFGTAKKLYERIVRSNGSILGSSPLYKDAKFAGVKQRVVDFLQPNLTNFTAAFGSSNTTENPAIIIKVLEAKNKLFQINSGLNFFGFAKNYLPPFSFEYLQGTARYFAQQASQIESKYIQFKSTAENEELRYEQLDQQVEVAEQSVILEERGVNEAMEGVDVAEATQDYAATRRQNAKENKDNFNDVRWELLELEEAMAWSSAAVTDEDDEIKQSWNGHYYSSNKKRRSSVLKDLAYQKGRINQDLQADSLQNAFEDAQAYEDLAEEQVDQAKARQLVAEQRLEIAKLQKRHAEENREFLQLKEFGASQWYKMAKLMKRLSRKYLNQATEIAMLTQRAYRAETERGVRPIRYDYVIGRPGGLLGADQLLQDIDYFTFDMVTNIRSKKAPVKKTISLSDQRPMAFNTLINKGRCQFNTRLKDFDRDYPGMYLCKIKNIELVVVGITKATSIAGSLRNVGASRFRNSKGTIQQRLYPADIMPLSQYSFRNDALAFRFDPKDLKLFENHGVATLWELKLRPDANDFDLREILDIQLVVYYDGFYNANLENTIVGNLPANGKGTKGIGLRLMYPDELFYLRNQGEAVLDITTAMFPHNQQELKRSSHRLLLDGDRDFINGLKIRVRSEELDRERLVTANADGAISATAFSSWNNKPALDTWKISISPEDNASKLVDGKLPLELINDVYIPLRYSFKYRDLNS